MKQIQIDLILRPRIWALRFNIPARDLTVDGLISGLSAGSQLSSYGHLTSCGHLTSYGSKWTTEIQMDN